MNFNIACTAIAVLASIAQAAPTSVPTSIPASNSSLTTYPFALPPNFPSTSTTNISVVPNHFALFGYSYSGNISNQSYYSPGVPYKKLYSSYLETAPSPFQQTTFGSYTFGIGPGQHLFAYSSGKIAAYNTDGGPLSAIYIEPWQYYYKDRAILPTYPDRIPTCQVIPAVNALYCELDGQPLKFAFCSGDGLPDGSGLNVLNWAATYAGYEQLCDELVLHVVQVPKTYGDQSPAHGCEEQGGC